MSTYRNRSLQLFSILLVSPGLSGDLYQKELLHRRSFESIAKYDILWPLKHCPTCPTCFKDPRIRIPSFDEAMREILSYREGKATSTRRRKHKKKKRWLCIRQDVKSQSERGICFEFCFVLSFDALCTGNECWPKSSLMLGRPIVCNLGTTRKEWTKANVIDVIWLFRYSPRWGWRVWLPLGSSRTKPRKLAPCDFELKAEICFSNPGWKIVHVTLSAVVSLEWKLQR